MTPQLRFPEFTDVWQVKKLGSLFSYEQPTKYLVSSTDYADEYDTPVLTAGKTFVLGKTDESYGIFQEGLPITLFDDFTTASQWVDFPFKLKSSAAKILKAKDGYNPKIAHEILQKIKFKADDHQRYWISTYQNFDVKIPSKPEQEKIADFLTAVDERIAVGEKKLELLEIYKRGVMQKIFSQQIRFKDENGEDYPDWEEKKLDKFLTIPDRVKAQDIDRNKILTVKLHSKGVTKSMNTETLSLGSTGYYIRKSGQFIYGKQNLFNGAFGIIPNNFEGYLSSGDVPALDINESCNPEFLLYLLSRKTFYKQLEKFASGTGSKRIHEQVLLKIGVKVPQIEEQQKIAAFLTTLDDKITAEKSKITAAREFKKALLQRMFVC